MAGDSPARHFYASNAGSATRDELPVKMHGAMTNQAMSKLAIADNCRPSITLQPSRSAHACAARQRRLSMIYFPTMTRPILALVFATAMCTLVGSCDRLHAVSGKYHQQENPSETLVLSDDGTCLRDNFACTYALKGNEITITTTMPTAGTVNGTIDGKRLTIAEPNAAGGKDTKIFIRE